MPRSRREEAKRKARIEYAFQEARKGNLEFLDPQANLLDYGMKNVDDLPAQEVDVYDRATRPKQKEALEKHSRGAKIYLEDRGWSVHHVWTEIADGKCFDGEYRVSLVNAVRSSEKQGNLLGIPCPTRLGRPPDFNPNENFNVGLRVSQMEKVLEILRGRPVVFLNSIHFCPIQDRTFLDELGKLSRGRKRGKEKEPYEGFCKDRKSQCLEFARTLRKRGESFRKIAREVSLLFGIPVTERTIRNWLRGDE